MHCCERHMKMTGLWVADPAFVASWCSDVPRTSPGDATIHVLENAHAPTTDDLVGTGASRALRQRA